MIRTLTVITLVCVAIACSPPQTETATVDSTAVAPDTVKLSAVEPPAKASTEIKEGEKFEILDSPGYVSNPFAFSLDSASLVELLGPDVEINSIWSPAGENDYGASESKE